MKQPKKQPGHSTHSFLFISALPNELNEEMNRVDGLRLPKRIENELGLFALWGGLWAQQRHNAPQREDKQQHPTHEQ